MAAEAVELPTYVPIADEVPQLGIANLQAFASLYGTQRKNRVSLRAELWSDATTTNFSSPDNPIPVTAFMTAVAPLIGEAESYLSEITEGADSLMADLLVVTDRLPRGATSIKAREWHFDQFRTCEAFRSLMFVDDGTKANDNTTEFAVGMLTGQDAVEFLKAKEIDESRYSSRNRVNGVETTSFVTKALEDHLLRIERPHARQLVGLGEEQLHRTTPNQGQRRIRRALTRLTILRNPHPREVPYRLASSTSGMISEMTSS